MKKLLSFVIRAASGVIGVRNVEKILIFSAKSIHANLHEHGLIQIVAGTNVYLENGSELFFIKNVLPGLFTNKSDPIVFDVGANIGNYTLYMVQNIINADVYAFEPVQKTFAQLKTNIGAKANLYNLGFSNVKGREELYNSTNTSLSEIATVYKGVLIDIFKLPNEIEAIEIEMDTIDNFCITKKITVIEFLKIDVEGNELKVLQGASLMLANGNIKVIQFEFNTHNVYSRVFLRDFYLLLNQYEFYRLKSNGILRLGEYNPKNEIFTAQNIIAVHNTLSRNINSEYLLKV